MWLHIDAAWAGVTLACPEYRETAQLPGINDYADSLCINFHKVTLLNETQLYVHPTNPSGSGA
jgi:glutamate/tyrosine decarboxylase-like PLP-dependent enzyme